MDSKRWMVAAALVPMLMLALPTAQAEATDAEAAAFCIDQTYPMGWVYLHIVLGSCGYGGGYTLHPLVCDGDPLSEGYLGTVEWVIGPCHTFVLV